MCGALAALSAATDVGAGGGLKDRRRTGRLAFCPPGALRGVPAEGGVAEIAGRTRPETPPRGKAFPHRGDGRKLAVQTKLVLVRQNLSQFVIEVEGVRGNRRAGSRAQARGPNWRKGRFRRNAGGLSDIGVS